jgi:steroid delta-isomerase-like uncharacterized protein
MSTAANKSLVRRMYAALDRGDLEAVPELFDPAWVNRDAALPPMAGHDGARQLMTLLKTAFPDFATTVEALIAEEDRVAARVTHTGTHLGEFMGIPPTGQRVSVTASGLFRVAGGRLTENHVVFDALGLLRQLGVVPAPAGA